MERNALLCEGGEHVCLKIILFITKKVQTPKFHKLVRTTKLEVKLEILQNHLRKTNLEAHSYENASANAIWTNKTVQLVYLRIEIVARSYN